MVQVDLVPKRMRFAWHNAWVDDQGRGHVYASTKASTVTMSTWFTRAGADVQRMTCTDGVWEIIFVWAPIEEGQG